MVRTGNDKEMYTATYNQNSAMRVFRFISTIPAIPTGIAGADKLQHHALALFQYGQYSYVSISMTGYRYEYDNQADKGCTFRSVCRGATTVPLAITVTWQWDGQQSGRLFQPCR